MRYSIGGEELARLMIAAGARMDADEIGEIVHRVKLISEQADPSADDEAGMWDRFNKLADAIPPGTPPAKPE